MAEPLKTRPFQIPRLKLAYLAAEEYVRTLWWYVAIVPIFGIAMVIFGSGFLQAVGFMAILWPLSLPARGIVSTSKAGRLFGNGCLAVLDEEFLTFYDTTDRPKPLRWKLPLISVRDVIQRRDFYLVRTRKLGFVAVPLSAFESDDDKARFVRIIQKAIEKRLSQF